MKILLFGSLVDTVGKSELEIRNVENTNILKEKIFSEHPQLHNQSFLIAVNKKVQRENILMNENDVIALLPPFSGG